MEEESLYQENILEHSRNPQNLRELFLSLSEIENNNTLLLKEKGDNPSCGDSGTLYLKVKKIESSDNIEISNHKEDYLILEASFLGNGCAISQASFDMLTLELKGKLFSEIRSWTPAKIYDLLKIKITPARVNCALLSYRALEGVLKKEI